MYTLYVPSGTHWSTSSDTHQGVEKKKNLQVRHHIASWRVHYRTWPYCRFWPYYQISEGFHRTLKRVRLANRGRLLLQTPGPVPFGTCICSNIETIFSWACHVFGLWISNIPLYFYFASHHNIVIYVIDIPYCRYMLGLSGVPSLIQFLGLFLLPESPRWLIGKQKLKEARAALIRIRGTTNIEDEISDIEKAVKEEADHTYSTCVCLFWIL